MSKNIKIFCENILFNIKYYFIILFLSKKNNIVIINKPLVLISQIQRSGGSLISQLFDNHPLIYSYPHELFVFKPVWNWNSKLSNFLVYKMPEMKIYAKNKIYYKNAKAKWNENYKFNFNLFRQKYIFKKLKHHTSRDKFNNFFTSFFNSYNSIGNEDKKYVVAFTPRVNMDIKSVNKFFEIYDDGYMINCVRNPLDWLASANKTMDKYKNFNFALEMWLQSTKNSIMIKKIYKNSILIIFEDLITNTEGTMKKIADKLKIRFSKNLLIPSFNGEKILSNSSFQAKFNIDNEVINRKKTIDISALDEELVSECLKYYKISKNYSI